jgi:hypothetical protein
MADEANKNDERALNQGLDEEEQRLRDPERRPPRGGVQSDASEPEPTTPKKAADEDVANLENPPQTEGPRERSNEGV